jgi:Tfp pilus assembly protein PilV
MDRPETARGEAGFTIIEVMVAAAVLLVGVLGVMLMLDTAQRTTTTNKAREQGVALQRELLEAARSVPYADLVAGSVAARVSVMPGLGDDNPGAAGWQLRRRGIEYTVSLGTCSVDDPADELGAQQPGFCVTGAGQTSAQQCVDALGTSGSIAGTGSASATVAADCGIDANFDGTIDGLALASGTTCSDPACDPSPDDYKRVVSLVRWDRGGGQRFVHQSSTLPFPGLSNAPAVTALTAAPSTTILTGTTLTLNATTNRPASALSWTLDGTLKDRLTGSGTGWTWTWDLGDASYGAHTVPAAGEVVDGTYYIGAKAHDAYGNYGLTLSLVVTVNRRVPFPPQGFVAGLVNGAVESSWIKNREKDLRGYRVYRQAPSGSPQVVAACALTQATECRDTSPLPQTGVQYWVVGVQEDGVEGVESTRVTLNAANQAPTAPSLTTCTLTGSNLTLNWSASSDPDAGDSARFYWIYRDGTTVGDRVARTAVAGQVTWTEPNVSGAHTYWISAVDGNLAESPLSPNRAEVAAGGCTVL